MLQELLMSTPLNDQERKPSIPAPLLTNSTPSSSESAPLQEKLQCPRCNSKNTKFCYYNNYNLTQPRHFCKTCRRYWTKGGALRNVPIGGGCRKSKPSSLAHKARPVPASSDDIMPPGLGTYNSHLLDLLKGSSSNHFMQSPYNVNLNSFRVVKEEIVDGNYGYQQQMPTSSGVQELYQRSQRSNNYSGQFENMTGISSGTSTANYNDYCSSLVLTSKGAESIMEQVNPLHINGDLGSWINGAGMTWSDISASNGRFH